MSEVRDFLGNPISVGDMIVYPVRSRSEMWLQKRKVSQVVTSPTPRIVVYDPDSAVQRGHSVKNLHTVVVVDKAA